MLNKLLANNVDLAVTDDDGNTPLHYAAMEGKHANVKILLASKAESQVRNLDGDTPYNMAKAYGHSACARLLRKKRR
jgi:ankyrin repeat protein